MDNYDKLEFKLLMSLWVFFFSFFITGIFIAPQANAQVREIPQYIDTKEYDLVRGTYQTQKLVDGVQEITAKRDVSVEWFENNTIRVYASPVYDSENLNYKIEYREVSTSTKLDILGYLLPKAYAQTTNATSTYTKTLYEGLPTTNLNGCTVGYNGAWKHSCSFGFDVPALGSQYDIDAITFHIKTNTVTGTARTFQLFESLRNGTSNVDWSTYDGSNSWGSGGARSTTTDTAYLDELSMPSNATWYELDATDLGQIDGTAFNLISYATDETGTNYTTFYYTSSDAPYLEIAYSEISTSSTSTTSTSTATEVDYAIGVGIAYLLFLLSFGWSFYIFRLR